MALAKGGESLDQQRRSLFESLFGCDDEDERLPSPLMKKDESFGIKETKLVQPAAAVELKQQQQKQSGRIVLKLRRIPGTNRYQVVKKQDADAHQIPESKIEDPKILELPKTEAPKRKHCDAFERQEKGKQSAVKNQGSSRVAKRHGNSVRGRIDWKIGHLSVRRPKPVMAMAMAYR